MNQMLEKIWDQTGNIFNSIISLLKVLLCSRWRKQLPTLKNTNPLIILGNGPSLAAFLAEKQDFRVGKELLVVNYAVLSPYFVALKPRYFVAIDPLLFCDETASRKLFTPMVELVTWEMELFVPYRIRKQKLFKELLQQNKQIKLHYINTTPIKGNRTISQWIFSRQWGMPSPRNVLVPSLMVAVWLGYKEVYTAGVDHSWHTQLWVDDNNRLMINDAHYYDKEKSKYVRHGNFTIGALFYSLYLAFTSYHDINGFALHKGCHIYNITTGSYIDAFERKQI